MLSRIRRWTLVCFICLTAAMTVVAGVPVIICACPPQKGESTCSKSDAKAALCCCCGTCNACDGQSCCAKREQPANTATFEAVHGCCIQDTLHVEPLAASSKTSSIHRDVTPAPSSPLEAPRCKPVIVGNDAQTAWQFHLLPPPTNLVVTLQRLTI